MSICSCRKARSSACRSSGSILLDSVTPKKSRQCCLGAGVKRRGAAAATDGVDGSCPVPAEADEEEPDLPTLVHGLSEDDELVGFAVEAAATA